MDLEPLEQKEKFYNGDKRTIGVQIGSLLFGETQLFTEV